MSEHHRSATVRQEPLHHRVRNEEPKPDLARLGGMVERAFATRGQRGELVRLVVGADTDGNSADPASGQFGCMRLSSMRDRRGPDCLVHRTAG